MSAHEPRDHEEEDAFLRRLFAPPRPTFAAALYDRLAREGIATRHHRRWWRLDGETFRGPAWLALAGAMLLLVLAGMAIPAVAHRAALPPHSSPREVTPAADGLAPVLPAPVVVTHGSVPAGRRWESVAQLTGAVGVSLLAPTALPAGCAEQERFGVAAPVNVAYLTYSCVVISQQAVVRGGAAREEQPLVGAGSIQEMTVGEYPAYVVRGGWVVDAGGAQVWQDGLGLTLVLERDGLLVRLRAGGTSDPGLEGLVRIAQSLQALR